MADDTNTNTDTNEIQEMQEITDKEAKWEGAAALLRAYNRRRGRDLGAMDRGSEPQARVPQHLHRLPPPPAQNLAVGQAV